MATVGIKPLVWTVGEYPPAWDYDSYSAIGFNVTYIVHARRTGRNEPGDWEGNAEVRGRTGYDRYARDIHFGKCAGLADGMRIAAEDHLRRLNEIIDKYLEIRK